MDKNYQKVIAGFYKKNRRLPSYREIMNITGLKSTNAVHKLMKKLIDLGTLARDTMGHIVPKNIFGTAQILGSIKAGFPSPAEEELKDTMSLDEYLIKNPEATYLLKVDGDSMIDAGIMKDDMVLVERGTTPRPGDIVVAEIDKQWTLKFLRRKGTGYYLEAGNSKYPDLIPTEELKIAAVVRAVIRKY